MRLSEIRALAPQLRQLIESHGGTNLAVIGSVARGVGHPQSPPRLSGCKDCVSSPA
jgi:hypothetical protein